MILKEQKGFTLAEILMISAIVALIGSIILIFSKGAIEKAKIAKLLQFSASIHHALGAYLIAEYKFEENGYNTCPGGDDFCDTSGNGNHGSVLFDTGVSQAPNSEIPQLGKSGYFDGSNSIEVRDVENDSGFITIQAWIKPLVFPTGSGMDWEKKIIGSQDIFIFSAAIHYPLAEEKHLCFSSSNFPQLCSVKKVFEVGKWYHVVVTYGKSEVKLFVNAEVVGSSSTNGQPFGELAGERLVIGEGYFGSGNYKGYIDELRIYSEALSSAQIKKLYVEGAKKYVSNAEP